MTFRPVSTLEEVLRTVLLPAKKPAKAAKAPKAGGEKHTRPVPPEKQNRSSASASKEARMDTTKAEFKASYGLSSQLPERDRAEIVFPGARMWESPL